MAKKKQKFYAIKEGKNNTKNKIVNTWDECKKIVHGYPSVYKSFPTREECEKYLSEVNVEKVKEQAKKGIEHHKKTKGTTKFVGTRISKEMYSDLEKKSKELNLPVEMLIKFALTEYLY